MQGMKTVRFDCFHSLFYIERRMEIMRDRNDEFIIGRR